MANITISGKLKNKLFNSKKKFSANNIISSGSTGAGVVPASLAQALKSCTNDQSIIFISNRFSNDTRNELLSYAVHRKIRFHNVVLEHDTVFYNTFKPEASITAIEVGNYDGSDHDLAIHNNVVDALLAATKLAKASKTPPIILLDNAPVAYVYNTPVWGAILRASASACPFWIIEQCVRGTEAAYSKLEELGFYHLVFMLYDYEAAQSALPYFNESHIPELNIPSKQSMIEGECHVFSKEHLFKNKVLSTDYFSYSG